MPEKEMVIDVEPMEEEDIKEKPETMWGSIFGEKKERKVRDDLIPRHNRNIKYIQGIKPVIRPAFEYDV